MRAVRARTCRIPTVVALVVMTAALVGCSTTANRSDGSTHRGPPSVTVPLDTTLATSFGEVAVVAMGMLSNPHNTFWQVLSRPSATAQWRVVTPPGVADNGGVVVSSPAGSAGLLAGFEPSQALDFSPIALSVDQGRSWSPGLVQGGLMAVPDALATGSGSGSGSVALVRNGGGEVLRGTGTSSIGSKVASTAAIAASAAGKACDIGTLTAVALDESGATLVGASCTTPGVVGIFGLSGGTWRLVAPRLTGAVGAASTKVVRLVEAGGVANGLVASGDGSVTSLIGVARSTGGVWSRSPALSVGPRDRIASTGVESGGGFVVLVQRPDRSLVLELETGPGGPWQATTAPPRGTAAVVVGTGGVVDALAVASTRFTDWRLDTSTASWTKIGTVTVPIAFGSSS